MSGGADRPGTGAGALPAPDRPDAANTFSILRRLERQAGNRPKIGRATVARDDIATLGQDPFTAFPAGDLLEVRQGPFGAPDLRVRFLGYYGPQGPLPLATTVEVEGWLRNGDRAFVDFTDILTTRFLQLFYRAWSDARPITQMDHPDRDRFQDFVASLAGFGTSATAYGGQITQAMRQDLVPLLTGRVKSASALRQMLAHVLETAVRIEEFVPMALRFEPEDRTRLGSANSGLGRSVRLGEGVVTVEGRICIHVRAEDMDTFFTYLPGGRRHALIHDLVKGYLGNAIDAQIAISMPARAIPPARLGVSAYLGWMAPLPPGTRPIPAPGRDGAAPATDIEVGRFALRATRPTATPPTAAAPDRRDPP